MPNRSRPLLTVLLLCIALLGVQAGNVHLHLCLDGQAPAASLHYGDDEAAEAHHIEVGISHHDYDIELGTHSVARLPKIDFTLVALLFPLVLLSLARSGPSYLRPAVAHVRRIPPRYLRPPSCGPPLNSVV